MIALLMAERDRLTALQSGMSSYLIPTLQREYERTTADDLLWETFMAMAARVREINREIAEYEAAAAPAEPTYDLPELHEAPQDRSWWLISEMAA